MAPARRRIKAAPANPSTVLVIFLVFFVLLSLGLGVWGYFGYKDAKVKDEAAKKEKDNAKKAADGENWYRLEALWNKAAAGHELTKEDQVQLSDLYGRLDGLNGPDKTLFLEAMKKDKLDLKWDDNAKRFASSYRAGWVELSNQVQELQAKVNSQDKELVALRTKEKERDKKFEEDWAALKKAVKEVNDRAQERADEADRVIADVQKKKTQDLAKYTNQIAQLQKDLADTQKSHAKVLKDKDEEIAKLLLKKTQLETKVGEKVASADLIQFESPKGKIVRMDRSGQMPYINLGRADGVKTQLTFSVFGVDAYGKVAKQPKASVEVVKVVGPHLCQAKTTSIRNGNSDPLQDGDLVYNPAWNPNQKTHVAIAGSVDLTGEESTVREQMRTLRSFMTSLERQNIVVDAYLDLQTLKMKGEITLKTDYFILGEAPALGAKGAADTKDEKGDVQRQASIAMAQMRAEANKKGVQVIALQKFAVLMGYRIPKTTRTSTLESDYRPADKGEKPAGDGTKKDDKKGDRRLGEEDKKKE
jgi:hypothetical protein